MGIHREHPVSSLTPTSQKEEIFYFLIKFLGRQFTDTYSFIIKDVTQELSPRRDTQVKYRRKRGMPSCRCAGWKIVTSADQETSFIVWCWRLTGDRVHPSLCCAAGLHPSIPKGLSCCCFKTGYYHIIRRIVD